MIRTCPKGTKREITIQTGNGPLEVSATTYGNLALHRSTWFPDKWTITHIPSGRALEKGLTKRREAVALLKKLSLLGPWDWERPIDAPAQLLLEVRELIYGKAGVTW